MYAFRKGIRGKRADRSFVGFTYNSNSVCSMNARQR
jgi:hypothetical protein